MTIPLRHAPDLTGRSNTPPEHSLPTIMDYHKSPTAWLPVAREVSRYLCGDASQARTCNHRSLSAACRCRKGTHLYGKLNSGAIIRVTPRHLRASNGESCVLPFPTTEADYLAASPLHA